jgi:hypothetical protein
MTYYVERHGRRIAVETVSPEPGTKPKPSAKAKPEAFAKVPLDWAAKATKATRTPQAMVWVILLHAAWQAKGLPFTLSNTLLAKYGISRELKRRTLQSLESAGLVSLYRKPGQSLTITLNPQ